MQQASSRTIRMAVKTAATTSSVVAVVSATTTIEALSRSPRARPGKDIPAKVAEVAARSSIIGTKGTTKGREAPANTTKSVQT